MKLVIFLMGLLILSMNSIADQAVQKTPKLLVLGDSLSAAYGMNEQDGWVALLQSKVTDWSVVNASISGETSQGGLNRLPTLLATHQPRIVIIELGANDGLRVYSTQTLKSNLRKIIELSQASGARVLLLGMKIPSNYGRRYTEEFYSVYTSLVDEHDIDWVPFFLEGVALDNQYLLSDNIHPNEAAQPILFNTVWTVLEPMLNLENTH